MRINLKKLIVETQSGIKLGKVCDLVLETDGQTVLQYEVCGGLFCSKKYLISRNQVVRFEEGKIIVDDSVKKLVVNSETVKENVNVEPALMREE